MPKKTMNKFRKKVAVLGGGVSGLAAALTLAEGGFKVIVAESSPYIGGAAGSVGIPDGRIASIGYHHIVGSDKRLLEVLNKLDLISRVNWKKIHVSTLVDKKNIDLASPKDVMLFKRLPFISRFKYMFLGARCMLTKDWSSWKDRTVTEFVKSWADEKVLQAIFAPLVDIKFGLLSDQADAAWLGRRLSHAEGRTPFGFIPCASWNEEMCQEFKRRIESLGGEIMLNTPLNAIALDKKGKVKSVKLGSKTIKVDAALNTIPPPALNPILIEAKAPSRWLRVLGGIKYMSCYSLLAGLPTVPFRDYWTVFLYPRAIFGGCFSISNLNHTLITKKDKAVINLFTNLEYGKRPWSLKKYEEMVISDLQTVTGKKIRPNWVKTNIIKFVSPIFSVGYKNPPAKLGENLYLAGIYRTYPKFSTTGEAMASGIETANLLLKDFN